MDASLTLVVVMGVLFATGMYMMMERGLTRILIGFLLVGNAVNILILLVSARPGAAPIVTEQTAGLDKMSDPLPQALILTAIVINLGVTAFMLALIYRSWWLAQLGDGDVVVDESLVEEEAIESDVVFELSQDDDEAIQHALEASEDEADEEQLDQKERG